MRLWVGNEYLLNIFFAITEEWYANRGAYCQHWLQWHGEIRLFGSFEWHGSFAILDDATVHQYFGVGRIIFPAT